MSLVLHRRAFFKSPIAEGREVFSPGSKQLTRLPLVSRLKLQVGKKVIAFRNPDQPLLRVDNQAFIRIFKVYQTKGKTLSRAGLSVNTLWNSPAVNSGMTLFSLLSGLFGNFLALRQDKISVDELKIKGEADDKLRKLDQEIQKKVLALTSLAACSLRAKKFEETLFAGFILNVEQGFTASDPERLLTFSFFKKVRVSYEITTSVNGILLKTSNQIDFVNVLVSVNSNSRNIYGYDIFILSNKPAYNIKMLMAPFGIFPLQVPTKAGLIQVTGFQIYSDDDLSTKDVLIDQRSWSTEKFSDSDPIFCFTEMEKKLDSEYANLGILYRFFLKLETPPTTRKNLWSLF